MKLNLDKNKCWEWKRTIRGDGYGKLRVHGKDTMPHRISYHLFKGWIPRGKCILHHCDNKKCFNPNHLFIGTRVDNALDRDKKGRTRNGVTRLSVENVKEIREMSKNGIIQKDIAEKFGVNRTQISRIVNYIRHARPREVTRKNTDNKRG